MFISWFEHPYALGVKNWDSWEGAREVNMIKIHHIHARNCQKLNFKREKKKQKQKTSDHIAFVTGFGYRVCTCEWVRFLAFLVPSLDLTFLLSYPGVCIKPQPHLRLYAMLWFWVSSTLVSSTRVGWVRGCFWLCLEGGSSASTAGLCSSRVNPFLNHFLIYFQFFTPQGYFHLLIWPRPFCTADSSCRWISSMTFHTVVCFSRQDLTGLPVLVSDSWAPPVLPPWDGSLLNDWPQLHPMSGSLSSNFFPSDALSNTCLANACNLVIIEC